MIGVDPGGGSAPPRILAWGGHDFSTRAPDRAVCDFMLDLIPRPTPRVCLLPTASGDPTEQISRFHSVFWDRDCEASDLSLFRLGRKPVALRDHLLSQDLIYVGGGSMVNLLAIWEAHEIASILSLAWKQGVVLAGQSAGAMCWFEVGLTKSSGHPLAAAGLGLLRGSLCVHYHQEPGRRAEYLSAVAEGMPGGYGLDDHAGLLWEGKRLVTALSARPGARAYRAEARDGVASERALPAVQLHPAPPSLPPDIAEFRRVAATRHGAGR